MVEIIIRLNKNKYMQYKAGDKVRVKSYDECNNLPYIADDFIDRPERSVRKKEMCGEILEIYSVHDCGTLGIWQKDKTNWHYFDPNWVEPVNIKNNTINKTMENVKTFYKNMTISKEEKLLRKHGLKTECGTWTDEAKDIAMQMLCDSKQAELTQIVTDMEAEEKE